MGFWKAVGNGLVNAVNDVNEKYDEALDKCYEWSDSRLLSAYKRERTLSKKAAYRRELLNRGYSSEEINK